MLVEADKQSVIHSSSSHLALRSLCISLCLAVCVEPNEVKREMFVVVLSILFSSLNDRLEDQANKAKKILSANLETGFHVECLVEDQDCSGLLTRDVFEDLCSKTLALKLQKLLQSALEKSGTQHHYTYKYIDIHRHI